MGVTGAYSGGSAMDYAAITGFASNLLGCNPLQRENIYNDLDSGEFCEQAN
jgi:hypothetical protein